MAIHLDPIYGKLLFQNFFTILRIKRNQIFERENALFKSVVTLKAPSCFRQFKTFKLKKILDKFNFRVIMMIKVAMIVDTLTFRVNSNF
jgi:hypothetical protein